MIVIDNFLKNILVEESSNNQDTAISIPKSLTMKTRFGKVVATAKSVTSVKVGDKILFEKYAGVPVEENGKNYLLMREADTISVIN